MKKRQYYLAGILLLSILLYVSYILSQQEAIKYMDLGFIFRQKKAYVSVQNQLSYRVYDKDSPIEILAMDKYLHEEKSPFQATQIPSKFIKRVRENNTKSLIRNGNLPQVDHMNQKYQKLLRQFLALSDSLGLPVNITRKEYSIRWKQMAYPQKGKGKVWSFFFQRRLNLRKVFKRYKEELALILSTERVIWEQKKHFPELHKRMNSLRNLDGSKLPIYIISYPKVISGAGQSVAGLSIFGKYQGLLTSFSPEFSDSYPGLIGKKNALTVHLKKGVAGNILSHEFGHLYYLYYHWQDYLYFIRNRQGGKLMGGHGPNDPSGLAAELAEKGIMPKF